MAGFCEHGDEPLGSIQCGVFFDKLRSLLLGLLNNLHGCYKHNSAKVATAILTEIYLLLPSAAVILCSYNCVYNRGIVV